MPEVDDECKSCHATMTTREGCEPTELCDNCAHATVGLMRAEVRALKGALKLKIGRAAGIPWNEVSDSEVLAYMAEWSKLTRAR